MEYKKAVEIDDSTARNKIYKSHLEYPFRKMIQSIFHDGKFAYMREEYFMIEQDVLIHLFEKVIPGFNPSTGKAYSYITRSIYNYFIIENNKRYKKFLTNEDNIELIDEERDVVLEEAESARQDEVSIFLSYFIFYLERNLHKIFDNDRDQHIGRCLIDYMKNPDKIGIIHKKSIYILVREKTNYKTQHITKVNNHLKKIYFEILTDYQLNNNIFDHEFKSKYFLEQYL